MNNIFEIVTEKLHYCKFYVHRLPKSSQVVKELLINNQLQLYQLVNSYKFLSLHGDNKEQQFKVRVSHSIIIQF